MLIGGTMTAGTRGLVTGDGPGSGLFVPGQVGVDHLLWVQANHADPMLATVLGPEGTRVAHEPLGGRPQSIPEALAATTRLAQQNLSALIDALATATSRRTQPLSNPAPSGLPSNRIVWPRPVREATPRRGEPTLD